VNEGRGTSNILLRIVNAAKHGVSKQDLARKENGTTPGKKKGGTYVNWGRWAAHKAPTKKRRPGKNRANAKQGKHNGTARMVAKQNV